MSIKKSNWESKEYFIKQAPSHYQKDEGSNIFEIPLINNSGEDTENHEKQMTQVLPIWDCVDVDKRLIFHVVVGNGATIFWNVPSGKG